jgi:DNA-binding transcriptional MocR family regulator
MSHPLRRLRLAEQIAVHLREGFQSGRWVGQLPGAPQLANELRVSNQTVRAALKRLEAEGWLEDGAQAAGERSWVNGPPNPTAGRSASASKGCPITPSSRQPKGRSFRSTEEGGRQTQMPPAPLLDLLAEGDLKYAPCQKMVGHLAVSGCLDGITACSPSPRCGRRSCRSPAG